MNILPPPPPGRPSIARTNHSHPIWKCLESTSDIFSLEEGDFFFFGGSPFWTGSALFRAPDIGLVVQKFNVGKRGRVLPFAAPLGTADSVVGFPISFPLGDLEQSLRAPYIGGRGAHDYDGETIARFWPSLLQPASSREELFNLRPICWDLSATQLRDTRGSPGRHSAHKPITLSDPILRKIPPWHIPGFLHCVYARSDSIQDLAAPFDRCLKRVRNPSNTNLARKYVSALISMPEDWLGYAQSLYSTRLR